MMPSSLQIPAPLTGSWRAPACCVHSLNRVKPVSGSFLGVAPAGANDPDFSEVNGVAA